MIEIFNFKNVNDPALKDGACIGCSLNFASIPILKNEAFRAVATFILVLFIIFCCSSSEKGEISNVLKNREIALETKNLSLYMKCVSENYNDGKKNYEGIKNDAKNNFLAFNKIELSFDDRNIYVESDRAEVYQKVLLKVDLNSDKKYLRNTEHLKLAKENGVWKIVEGL